MIPMYEKNYQLNYSKSYTGNLHTIDSISEGCQYSMPIDRAFESLLSHLPIALFKSTLGDRLQTSR